MQIEIFNNLLTAPRTVSNTYAQVARAQSRANHVQHSERLSRATCRITCHVVLRDSSAIEFDRVEIAFIWALFHWLNHLPIKEGRKPEYLEKTPGDILQKMPHYTDTGATSLTTNFITPGPWQSIRCGVNILVTGITQPTNIPSA